MYKLSDTVFHKFQSFVVLSITVLPILKFTLIIYYHTTLSLHFATNLPGSLRVINHLGTVLFSQGPLFHWCRGSIYIFLTTSNELRTGVNFYL